MTIHFIPQAGFKDGNVVLKTCDEPAGGGSVEYFIPRVDSGLDQTVSLEGGKEI